MKKHIYKTATLIGCGFIWVGVWLMNTTVPVMLVGTGLLILFVTVASAIENSAHS